MTSLSPLNDPASRPVGETPPPVRKTETRSRPPLLFLWIIGAVVLLIAAFFLWRGSWLERKTAAPVLPVAPVAAATKSDLSREISFSAEFRPYQEVAVHAKVAGYVKNISVDIGDHVKAGQVLAVLEVPELQDDLHKAIAATGMAKQDVIRAQADYDDAHAAFTRLNQVAQAHPNLIAQQDIDTAQAHDQAVQASLQAAQQRVEEAAATESKTAAMLAYCQITAPFDGVVTKRFADTGALVQAGTASNVQALPLVMLAQDTVLRLDFPVQESAVPGIRVGQAVEVSVGALGETFPAKISRFSDKIDLATRTMTTEVEVPNPDGRYTPGMYASVKLFLDRVPAALSIPIQALEGENGRSVLVVKADHTVERRAVKVGLQTASRAQILDGLSEGELVVIAKGSQFQPGEKVVPKTVD